MTFGEQGVEGLLRKELTGFEVHTKHRRLAVLVAHQHVNQMVYVPEMGGWFVFDGMRWVLDVGDVRVMALMAQTVRLCWAEVASMPTADDEQKKARNARARDATSYDTKPGCAVLLSS